MILIVTTAAHTYTHRSVREEKDVEVRIITYEDLQQSPEVPRATYVFTDLDRLTPARVHHMAIVYREMRQAGCRVLNDPARVLGRFGLLRALNRAGINEFDAYRVDALEVPQKWPVFLRIEGSHNEPVSGLLQNKKELSKALAKTLDEGVPRSALLIIEYAAEPVKPGVFRKLSAFRVGDRILGYTCVHEDKWIVKYGNPNVATPDMYEEEYQLVAANPFGEALMPVFELAGIDYGRVDFGLVGGRPQIYEINTNPHLKLRPQPSASPTRNESTELFRNNYLEALRAIDPPLGLVASADSEGATV